MAFYLIDKPKGMTSNKVSTQLKNQLNISKAGFSGVLDPFATGLLIIATEGETKFLDNFLNMDKTYSGKILFGKTTDTLDIDGNVIDVKEVDVNEDDVIKVVNQKFIGLIKQTPPIYSNIKVNGKRSHELARKGIKSELKSVERTIHKFEIHKIDKNIFEFIVTVSSGTYIRSLARDIGIELNIPSMLIELRRESIGNISVDDAYSIENSKKANRKKLLNLTELLINDVAFKKMLDGKETNIDSTDNELIVSNTLGQEMLIMNVDDNIYKIKKRIK